MKKIIALLLLSLPAMSSAEWRLNPYTQRQDYYEGTTAVKASTGAIQAELTAYKVTVQVSSAALYSALNSTASALTSEISRATTRENAIGVSTGTIQADLSTEVSDRGIADTAIGVSTASIATRVTSLESSRTVHLGWLEDLDDEDTDQNNNIFAIGYATGTLRTDLTTLALSTGPLVNYANWNTAYGWGNWASSLTSTAAALSGHIALNGSAHGGIIPSSATGTYPLSISGNATTATTATTVPQSGVNLSTVTANHVLKAGDTMTGPLTVSTLTVTGSNGEFGVRVSSNVYIVGYSSAAKYYGDGSALTGIIAGIQAGATTTWTGQNTFTNSVTVFSSSLTISSGSFSATVPPFSSFVTVTGGTVSSSGTATIILFSTSGVFSTNYPLLMDLTVIGGGGGGGGSYYAGGGGAGGYKKSQQIILPAGSYTVTVGTAGTGGQAAGVSIGGDGMPSSFGSLLSVSGGGGGGNGGTANGRNGGSGGGGSGGSGVGGTGISGEGYDGGDGLNSGIYPSGGGGGAGGAGADGATTVGGAGGVGVVDDITGLSTACYAGGGSGTAEVNETGTPGAVTCGGGSGGTITDGQGQNATKYGSGGGGSNFYGGGHNHVGGNGYQGAVIISYVSTYTHVVQGGIFVNNLGNTEILASTTTLLSGYKLYVEGSMYVVNNVSALSFTDRTPYPDTLKLAYDSVKSMKKKKNGGVDHVNLNPYIQVRQLVKGKSVVVGRDLSATVSSQNEVIKDLIERIGVLEVQVKGLLPVVPFEVVKSTP